MSGRIVLFGATGYTGRLTAAALVESGGRPVLAGRNGAALAELASELGGLETAIADVEAPSTVAELVGRGDVIVATVGPFARWGDPAVEAAIAAGAIYIDSTGEPAFIRRVFERFGPPAEAAGAGLLTALGYDWAPGNLAGALALRDAGPDADRVEIGYFTTGGGLGGMSGGTRASLAGAMVEPSFGWRGGAIRTERGAARVRSFEAAGQVRAAISVGSSEHFTLPRIHPGLRVVNSYLGWFGSASRAMQAVSAVNAAIVRIPGARTVIEALNRRFVHGSTGGPGEQARAGTGSAVVAIAYAGERQLASVEVRGVNGYEFTARFLAWSGARAATAGLEGAGALGPAEAFGLDVFESGCAEAGISRV